MSAHAEAAVRHRLGLKKKFIMYSGASDERKNHLRLIKAYSILPEELRARYQLALVGRIPPGNRQNFEAQVAACGLSLEDVVITGGVSDSDLHALYVLCELFVFPSIHEGFGLPALEALRRRRHRQQHYQHSRSHCDAGGAFRSLR
jgi:glycosyltransferase involved in cell wall biosynthesis